MNSRILSSNDISTLESELMSFDADIHKYFDAAGVFLNFFSNQQIMQSFYASGKFGDLERERFSKIFSVVEKYYGMIIGEDSLVGQTYKFIDAQQQLLQSGKSN